MRSRARLYALARSSQPGYAGVLRVSLLFFLGILPFMLLEIGWFSLIIVGCTAFVLIGAEGALARLHWLLSRPLTVASPHF